MYCARHRNAIDPKPLLNTKEFIGVNISWAQYRMVCVKIAFTKSVPIQI